MNKKMQKFLIFVVVGLLIVVLTVSVFITLKNNSDHEAILYESVKSNIFAVSVAALELLDVDKFDSYNSMEDIDADITAYNQTLRQLRNLQETVGATYIYALKQIGGKYYFIFDTDTDPYPDNPDKNSTVFDEYAEISEVHFNAFLGRASAGIMNVQDQWGTFNTSAVPVRKGGKVIGIVCVDVEDYFIRAGQRAATINVFILVALLSVVMCANIFLIRRYVIKPISLLTDSVAGVHNDGGAIYGKERDDEIGDLSRKITEMISSINYRDNMLSTVNKATALIIQADVDKFEGALIESLGMMAKAVSADRVYIWENHTEDGKLYSTQLFEWSEGAPPQQGNEYTVDVSYDENTPGWEEKLSSGLCINGPTASMTPEEQAHLRPQGILSVLIVPVFVRNEFW